MRSLAIIPARGGSKGVKDKNIRDVGGQPLISYAIQCAQQSRKLNFFVVSTDSDRIEEISKKFNARIIRRPSELAQDKTPIAPVVDHVLEEIRREQSGGI